MAIKITDIEYFNNNWYFAVYGNDFQPHVYKVSSDLTQTTDLGVVYADAWNHWEFLLYNDSLYMHAKQSTSEDPAALIRIEQNNTFTYTGEPNFTWSSLKDQQFDYITEINNELWCIHREDTRIQVFNGVSWRTEGELYYSDTSGTLRGFYSNGTDIYLNASDEDRSINGFFKYNSSYVFNGTYGDTLKWEFVKEYDTSIIGNLITTFQYENKVFVSGTIKLAIFDFINLEYTDIQTIPNARFFIFNNLLHCNSSNNKIYKYDNNLWVETNFAQVPLNTTEKVINVNNKLYVANNATALTLNCIG